MLADFEQTMQLAAQESERHDHRYLGTEHALLGLLCTSTALAVSMLRSRRLTAEAVEAELARLEAEGVVPRADVAANCCAASGSTSRRWSPNWIVRSVAPRSTKERAVSHVGAGGAAAGAAWRRWRSPSS